MLDGESDGGRATQTDAEDRVSLRDFERVEENDDVVCEDGEVQWLRAALETVATGIYILFVI